MRRAVLFMLLPVMLGSLRAQAQQVAGTQCWIDGKLVGGFPPGYTCPGTGSSSGGGSSSTAASRCAEKRESIRAKSRPIICTSLPITVPSTYITRRTRRDPKRPLGFISEQRYTWTRRYDASRIIRVPWNCAASWERTPRGPGLNCSRRHERAAQIHSLWVRASQLHDQKEWKAAEEAWRRSHCC